MAKVRCEHCIHVRSAPDEAKHAGCYLEKNMPSRQSDAFLDEQQVPGDHEAINRRGNCPDWQKRPSKVGFLSWLLSA